MSLSEPPVISVLAGSPTEEELAALVVVLTAAAAPEPAGVRSDRPLAGGWKSYGRTLRRAHHPGPGAWRQSARH